MFCRSALAGLIAALTLTLTLTLTLALVPASSATGKKPAATTVFPVSITAWNGKVTVPRRPARIVSLSPTATETLFAIGAGPQVVAVDNQSDYPKSAPRTTLSGYTPNVEAIAAYKPDLVVISYDPKGLAQALGRLGIPVVFHNAAVTIPGAYQQIRQLGRVTGNAERADGLVSRMKKQIATTVARARARTPRASVYHELDPTLYTVTSNTFFGRVYGLFGLTNIADAAKAGSDYPQLSPEYVVSANPDVIVLADTVCCAQTIQTLAGRPGWAGVKAVRTGSVVRIDDSIASRWGPRLVNFVRAVGAALIRLGSS